jgi:hypothetical protein
MEIQAQRFLNRFAANCYPPDFTRDFLRFSVQLLPVLGAYDLKVYTY